MTCKPARTYEEQVTILEAEHSLRIDDRQRAISALRIINYYHLRGYYIQWMDKDQRIFLPDTTFEMILRLRDFDEHLRILLWPILLHIEIKFRTHIAYFIAHKYGPMGYTETLNFRIEKHALNFITIVEKVIEDNSREIFVRHYNKHYNGEFPIWIIVELLPFGKLSKLFSNLKISDQTEISEEHYCLDGAVVNSYLAVLSIVRNICAHNGRIYNKNLPCSIKISSENGLRIKETYGTLFEARGSTLFAVLLAIRDLSPIKEFSAFIQNFDQLLESYKDVAIPQRLGLPQNWKAFLLLQQSTDLNKLD